MSQLYADVGPPLFVQGYASVFGTVYDGGNGSLERVEPGAFDLSKPVYATFQHDGGPAYACTRDRTLRLWSNAHGLAFAFKLANTWTGLSLGNSIRRGVFRACSVCMANMTVEQEHQGARSVDVIRRAEVVEISICASACNPATAVWVSDEDLSAMPPFVASARARWTVGRMGQQVAANRAKAKHRPTGQRHGIGRPRVGFGCEDAAMRRKDRHPVRPHRQSRRHSRLGWMARCLSPQSSVSATRRASPRWTCIWPARRRGVPHPAAPRARAPRPCRGRPGLGHGWASA